MKAVVIVDMLNDFVNEKGALYLRQAKNLVANMTKLKTAGIVVYANDAHDEDDKEFETWPVHAVKGTYGAQVIDELTPRENDIVIEKKDICVFTNKDADEMLRGKKIDELYVSGIAIKFCIRDLILSSRTKYGDKIAGALQRGYKVNVVVDAIAGADVKPGDQYRVLMELGAGGARPVTTQLALAEISKEKIKSDINS